MKNKEWTVPIDPFISHMRISYEDSIRVLTEDYWRDRISSQFFDMPEVAERIRNERS